MSAGVQHDYLVQAEQRFASVFRLVPLKIGAGGTFSLHAELELDSEEEALVKNTSWPKHPS